MLYEILIYYKYRYNLYFRISQNKIKYIYYRILNEIYPQDWVIIKNKNIINIDNGNLIKSIGIENYENQKENVKYILFGYNILINRAKINTH